MTVRKSTTILLIMKYYGCRRFVGTDKSAKAWRDISTDPPVRYIFVTVCREASSVRLTYAEKR